MRLAALFLASISIAACGQGDPERPPQVDQRAAELSIDPYGLWSTERGQTIEVQRDGTFKYCDEGACAVGKTKPVANLSASIWLLDFNVMPLTHRLREMSEENVLLRSDPRAQPEADFMFGDSVSDGFRRRHCRGLPCRPIGQAERNIYRFVKVKDY